LPRLRNGVGLGLALPIQALKLVFVLLLLHGRIRLRRRADIDIRHLHVVELRPHVSVRRLLYACHRAVGHRAIGHRDVSHRAIGLHALRGHCANTALIRPLPLRRSLAFLLQLVLLQWSARWLGVSLCLRFRFRFPLAHQALTPRRKRVHGHDICLCCGACWPLCWPVW